MGKGSKSFIWLIQNSLKNQASKQANSIETNNKYRFSCTRFDVGVQIVQDSKFCLVVWFGFEFFIPLNAKVRPRWACFIFHWIIFCEFWWNFFFHQNHHHHYLSFGFFFVNKILMYGVWCTKKKIGKITKTDHHRHNFCSREFFLECFFWMFCFESWKCFPGSIEVTIILCCEKERRKGGK